MSETKDQLLAELEEVLHGEGIYSHDFLKIIGITQRHLSKHFGPDEMQPALINTIMELAKILPENDILALTRDIESKDFLKPELEDTQEDEGWFPGSSQRLRD